MYRFGEVEVFSEYNKQSPYSVHSLADFENSQMAGFYQQAQGIDIRVRNAAAMSTERACRRIRTSSRRGTGSCAASHAIRESEDAEYPLSLLTAGDGPGVVVALTSPTPADPPDKAELLRLLCLLMLLGSTSCTPARRAKTARISTMEMTPYAGAPTAGFEVAFGDRARSGEEAEWDSWGGKGAGEAVRAMGGGVGKMTGEGEGEAFKFGLDGM